MHIAVINILINRCLEFLVFYSQVPPQMHLMLAYQTVTLKHVNVYE